jgi:hypothetical protein
MQIVSNKMLLDHLIEAIDFIFEKYDVVLNTLSNVWRDIRILMLQF